MVSGNNTYKFTISRPAKRLFILIMLIPGFLFIEIINWICIGLDLFFYPAFRKVNIESPVIITGMPRSATTLCYNLLAANSEVFTSMKLWEILFAPSVIQKKLAVEFYRFDKQLNYFFLKSLKRFEHYFFRPMEKKHPVSLFNIEEDDYLFLHTFSTVSFALLFPRHKWFHSLKYFDTYLSEKRKQILMRYYKNCLKKHLFVFGHEKKYLAKSPSHTPKIRTIIQFFPGCRFIYLLRDPLETIASTSHLFYTFKNIFHVKGEKQDMLSNALLIADFWYEYPLVTCNDLHQSTLIILGFKQLTKNTKETIREICMKLYIPINRDYHDFIENAHEKAAGFKLKRNYSPAEYELDFERIKERYSFVYNNFHQYL